MPGGLPLVVTTLTGLEHVLAAELTSLGAAAVEPSRRAVRCLGDELLLYQANLWLRTAIKVLVPLTSFPVRSREDLYAGASAIPWEDHLGPNSTFAVRGFVQAECFPNTHFPLLVVKDAVVDRLRKTRGGRPSIDLQRPDLELHLHLAEDRCDLAINSSGESLARRGYRITQGGAPLGETLAAGMVALTGWDGSTPLVDPMCGSGTIAIEAALLATGIGPGSFRKEFPFQRWPGHRRKEFSELREEARTARKKVSTTILAADLSPTATRKTRQNLQAAGLEKVVEVRTCPFAELPPPSTEGTLVCNPPYGERLQLEQLGLFYQELGNTLKQRWNGYTAWILFGGREALRSIGLRTSARVALRNGELPCTFARFDLYEGSRRRGGEAAASPPGSQL
ncbi:MAG: hypothetical protein A2284_07530 [Deltaproteobacteria bacterium RIFOXYA12_FULL_61_11]|nr:MAG: hypothetical protein A2284_07530 [Deltaproteobacteria bacterium RIFOXYA12_FULL_61_11]